MAAEASHAVTRPARSARIFEFLRATGPSNVSSIAAGTGLSRPTVMSILTTLEGLGLARVSDPEAGARGRPASTWAVVPEAGAVIGIDLLHDTMLVASADLSGRVLAAELSSVHSPLREGRLSEVLAAINRHRDQCVVPVLGVTVSTTGVVDADGTIARSQHVPQWQGFPLGTILSERLRLPVRVENDINAAAFGEFAAWSADNGSDGADLLLVQLFHGMVSGLVLDGEIHRGMNWNAGEIGLTFVEDDDASTTSRLRAAAQSIGAISAVVDPSVVIVSAPPAQVRETLAAIRRHLTDHRDPGIPDIPFQEPRLGAGSACVGALALALRDALAALLDHPSPATICPNGLQLIERATAGGEHTAMVATRTAVTSQRRKLRFGVVGVGARSDIALHAEAPGNDVEIVACCDPHPQVDERVRDRLKREPMALTIVDTVAKLIDLDIEAALVTSPDDTHAAVACELLEAGVPVYLEKPIAIHLDDATRILETAYRTGTKLYVGHNMRHMSVVQTMRDLIRDGVIGEVKAVWCRHFVGSGGDYYFKDWHATREHTNGLLLQKAAHDLDVMHWLTGSHSTDVVGMGGLTLYGDVTDRSDHSHQLMAEWFSFDHWPPLSQKGLNPVIDVEDLSMMFMRLESGVFASYQQCHYTPDYWRNYTVIGTQGRMENFGDGAGGVVRVWNKRHNYQARGDLEYLIEGDPEGHHSADQVTMQEFLRFIREGDAPQTSPLGAWYAAAAAICATDSIRDGSTPRHVPELPNHLLEYFNNNQSR